MKPSDKGQQEEDGHVAAAQMAPKHSPEDVDFNTSISKSVALLKGDILIPVAGFLHLPPRKCFKEVLLLRRRLLHPTEFGAFQCTCLTIVNLFECSRSPNIKKVAVSSHILGLETVRHSVAHSNSSSHRLPSHLYSHISSTHANTSLLHFPLH